ncbi:hypothetical protein PT974_00313 [Cladobotryum mycophilum]|uniref:Knr4/Smi1-like domain-containing protein n=1 Tax=Cladobotryum mycophilum TaxID=491253 RepID=A0ABR0T0I2_9HYPO
MSPPSRKLVTLIFEDDLALVDQFVAHDFSNTYVGIHGRGGQEFQFTPKRENEIVTQKADIGLEGAQANDAFESFDLLFVPGGYGLIRELDSLASDSLRNGVRKLVDAASWVATFSQGSFMIAASGRLDGREATAHHMWMLPQHIDQWPNVKWDDKMKIVEDGKFITTYDPSVNELFALLATKFDLPVPEPSPPPPSLDQLALNEDLRHWAELLKKVHEVSLRSVEKQRAEGVDVSQEVLDNYPFLRPPATTDAIEEKESELGLQLPSDYKEFLKVSNGTGFSGVGSIPSLVTVEELKWEDSEECGLTELLLDTFPTSDGSQSKIELNSEEVQEAPQFERVLQLTDPDEDSLLFLLEPSFLRRIWEWAAEKKGVPIGDASEHWLVLRFVPWAASFKVYSTFEEYMRSRIPLN